MWIVMNVEPISPGRSTDEISPFKKVTKAVSRLFPYHSPDRLRLKYCCHLRFGRQGDKNSHGYTCFNSADSKYDEPECAGRKFTDPIQRWHSVSVPYISRLRDQSTGLSFRSNNL